jgi:DNA-binding response OmpR family regulator
MTRPSDVPTSRYRILVIEDDPHVARLIRVSLVRAGLECRYAADGESGVEAFNQSQPQLVLLR